MAQNYTVAMHVNLQLYVTCFKLYACHLPRTPRTLGVFIATCTNNRCEGAHGRNVHKLMICVSS